MEFDVTLMNPPYSKGLWMKFIEKALEMNTPIIATINPDPANLCAGGFGEKWKNICIENGIVYRNEVSHYFPNVNSGNIGAFVLNRNESPNLELIESGNPIFESIYSKVTTAEPTSFALRGSLRESKGEESTLSDNETDMHVHPCIMNCKSEGLLIKYSDQLKVSKKHAGKLSGRYVIINRFFGKNTPEKTPAFPIDNIEDYNLGNNCIAFKLEAGETLENFMSVYTNKVFRYVMIEMRNGGMDIQTRHLMSFLRLDLTKFWTDDELYAHFDLTQEEIEYVEATV